MLCRVAIVLLFTALAACIGRTAPPPQAPVAPTSLDDTMLLTIFLRHDQSKSLAEIQQLEDAQGFWQSFPPAGTQVVSWHVVMGIGQVVTLRLPAAKLRDVNATLERTAWKAFRTEYYATYDLWPVIADKLANRERAACPAPLPRPPPAAAQATP
jgi:hypothetical protein